MNPMELQEWASANEPDDKMLWRQGYWDQITFVRDQIASLVFASYEENKERGVSVISTHTSKSILLPVFRIELANGMAITMRYNFFNWKVSIDSPEEIDVDFMELFDPNEEQDISAVYCEGFPRETVFGCYAKNKRQFTVQLGSRHLLYTFFYILGHKLGLRKK